MDWSGERLADDKVPKVVHLFFNSVSGKVLWRVVQEDVTRYLELTAPWLNLAMESVGA